MDFEHFFKGKLAENGLTVAKFAEMIDTSSQNLSQRLKRGSITYDEAIKYAEKLGYCVEWKKI
jgi:hypothetical protein